MATRRRGSMKAAAEQAERGSPRTTTLRTDPVRITVDLDPGQHADLNAWLAASYPAVGGRVKIAPVIRALITELSQDAGLEARVLERVRDLLAEQRAARRTHR